MRDSKVRKITVIYILINYLIYYVNKFIKCNLTKYEKKINLNFFEYHNLKCCHIWKTGAEINHDDVRVAMLRMHHTVDILKTERYCMYSTAKHSLYIKQKLGIKNGIGLQNVTKTEMNKND